MTVTITERGSEAYVDGLGGESLADVIMECSYRPVGWEYLPQVKAGRSDGWVRLLKGNKFPLGLLARVEDKLQELDVDYDVLSDERKAPAKIDVTVRGLETRSFQAEAVDAAYEAVRGMIKAPTGAGKTAIAAMLIQKVGEATIVLVPTIDLLHQFHKFLTKHLEVDFPIGRLGDGIVDPQPITIATARTMAKALGVKYQKYEYAEYDDQDKTDVRYDDVKEFVESVGLLIVDEAHVLAALSTFQTAARVSAPRKVGLSASPWRDDGADLMLEAATGRICYSITAAELVRQKFLVPVMIHEIDTSRWFESAAWGQVCTRCKRQRPKFPSRGGKFRCTNCGGTSFKSEYQEAYKNEIVENVKRNLGIAKLVEGLQTPTLVLVKQVAHGKALEEMIPGSVFLSGKDSGEDRQATFARVRAGDLKVLIGTSIADQGIDVPALTNLVLCGGGKATTRHLQRIGRVVRPYGDKTYANVYRLSDGHVHRWFKNHNDRCLAVEQVEWQGAAVWV